MTITGIFTIRNAIKTGYPFLESILSVLPITDEFLISDGGSTDGTFNSFIKLKKTFPQKVKINQFQDKTSKRWECIDKHINYLISKARGEWIFEIQGDELFHEKDIIKMKNIIEKSDEYNSILQPRWDTNWDLNSAYTLYNTVRCFRNQPGVTSLQGGDYFVLDSSYEKLLKPILFLDIPFYHFNSVFPKNHYLRAKRHSKFLSTDDGVRHMCTENLKNLYNDLPNEIEKQDYNISKNVPAIIKGMSGYNKYFVRHELFNKEWLTKTTGLNYFFD